MHSVVVKNAEEAAKVVKEMRAKGWHVAAISNAGLPGELRRLTFLPSSAFTSPPKEPA